MQISEADIKSFLLEAKSHDVPIGDFAWVAKNRANALDPILLRKVSIEAIRSVLSYETILIIEYMPQLSGYKVWNLGTEEIIKKIENLWDKYGPDLNHGIFLIDKTKLSLIKVVSD